jgi:hypothetical protein
MRRFSAVKAGDMLEINLIRQSIIEMQGRADTLRGYL